MTIAERRTAANGSPTSAIAAGMLLVVGILGASAAAVLALVTL